MKERSKVARRNPAWTRDELILALDLYLRYRPLTPPQDHPEVSALSKLLNSLNVHLDPPDKQTFRNVNSVHMKLCNFLSLDPQYKGKGLTRGGAEDTAVWNEFSENPPKLALTAGAIRASAASNDIGALSAPAEEEEEFPEGRLLFRAHRARERNSRLSKLAKDRALKTHGRLACEACAFDFGMRYGMLGKGYIECHHVIAISELAPGAKTRLKDIVLLCSNCHRMVHRRRPWLGIGELKQLVVASSGIWKEQL